MNGFEKSRAAPGPMTSSICHAARVEAARIAGYLKSWNMLASPSRCKEWEKHGTERQAGEHQRAERAGQLALAFDIGKHRLGSLLCGGALISVLAAPFAGEEWKQPLEKALKRRVVTG